MARRSLPGPFSAAHLSSGLWQLTAEVPDGARVYLRGAAPEASKLLSDTRITALEFEWRSEGVMVSITGAGGARHFKSESVIHTPAARLYDSLPLASFDGRAQRFWKRVFRLIRIPGGRLVLGAIARRRRGRSGTASQ